MIELHYWTTPNGHKITIFLEESRLPYRIVPVNISAGDQFKPEFLKISPNNPIPAIVDDDPAQPGPRISVFELDETLLYLAEKTGSSCPRTYADGRTRITKYAATSNPARAKTSDHEEPTTPAPTKAMRLIGIAPKSEIPTTALAHPECSCEWRRATYGHRCRGGRAPDRRSRR